MTVSSMTAFARSAKATEWGVLTWEIRAVNHRYLEMSVRMPDVLRHLESDVRQAVQQQVKRGKIDISLQFQKSALMQAETISWEQVNALADIEQRLATHFSGLKASMFDILKWPGVLSTQAVDDETLGSIALSALVEALSTLKAFRVREGAALQSCLQGQAKRLLVEAASVEKRLPQVLLTERERVQKRAQELALSVDAERLEQEMLWLAQKTDVAEELQRIETHVAAVESVLQKGGVIGRRLDFLMQELNREANTMASKSVDVETTQAAVEMKVCIEQMREQVQNIE